MTEAEIQQYMDENYDQIKDHPESCACDDCWEWMIVTQK